MLFGGTNIKNYGLVLLKKNGAYDLPSRQQPTYYDWGDELTPLVEEDEINFQANVFSMDLLYDYRYTANTIDQAISFLEGLGEFALTLDEATGGIGVINCRITSVTSKTNQKGFYQLTLTMYNRVPTFPGTVPGQSSPLSSNAIAGVNASVFGLTFGKMVNAKTVGTSKQSKETVYLEANKFLNERNFKRVVVPCYIVGSSQSDALVKLENFKKTITAPGLKQLRYNGTNFSTYLSEGFKVYRINNKSIKFDLILNLIA